MANAETLEDVKAFLRNNCLEEYEKYFGPADLTRAERVIDNWFDDKRNYDGRWAVITKCAPEARRVLDMAAGCGTFVLYGLHNGFDVWGIEPEDWKLEYFKKKVKASGYPNDYLGRVICGVGEKLPFADNSFDLVTTYQTLEHVQDVKACILEMLRVLRPGGALYVIAPDYNSFFEPHYRVPFLPRMNKSAAALYLRLIKKPVIGLSVLNWTTDKEIIRCVRSSGYNVRIQRTRDLQTRSKAARLVRWAKQQAGAAVKIGRMEKIIDLWITRID